MKEITLFIGSKNLSSWSLRPWLFMKHHHVPFEERVIALGQPGSRGAILEHSPSGRVPALQHGALRIWESLAICEYAAETFGLQAWPLDPRARATARSVAQEMHAGFADLRREMPFDAGRPPAMKAISDAAAADIARVRQIWREARRESQHGGEWLFGRFTIADAMFAPVALRFHSYAVALEGVEREYMFSILMHPAVQEWIDAARAEVPAQPAHVPAPVAPQPAVEKTLERTVDTTVDRISEMVKLSAAAAAAAEHDDLELPPVTRQAPAPTLARPAQQVPSSVLPEAVNRPVMGRVPPAPKAPAPKAPPPAPARTKSEGEHEGDPRTEPVIRTVIMPPD